MKIRYSKTAPVCVVAALLVAACSGGEQASGQRGGWGGGWNQDQDRIPAVEAVEVVLGTLPLEERLAGSVRARNQTEIFAEVNGQIIEVLANNGDQVEAGDPLVRLRDIDYRERLRQAESGLAVASARVQQSQAALTRAQATLRRVEAMAERSLTSIADLEAAQADALSAEADLTLMRAQLEQAESLVAERRADLSSTVVRAPVSGVVGGRFAEVGQMTSGSSPLFVIGDTSDMIVEITLTQRMLGYIRPGTTTHIVSDAAPEQAIEAAITRISPFLHPISRTTTAEIEVNRPSDLLLPGMFVTVDVLYGETEVATVVPNSAIYRHPRDGRTGVFAASAADMSRPATSEGEPLESIGPLQPIGPVAIEFVPVELVARGRLTSAVSGVEPGDWVVTLGHHLLESSQSGQALIQPTPWDHIIRLQQMQTRDLLDVIRRRQDALASGVPIESLN